MNTSRHRVSVNEARQIDMVEYLLKLGHSPAKIRNFDYWYLSPLREEKTPSFKVNRKLNCWYDHGIGKGGNVVDFAILYHNCTVSEFLQEVNGYFSFHPPATLLAKLSGEKTEGKIAILSEKTLSSYALERYLMHRRISITVAKEYCKEVCYELNDKKYFGIGFKNDAGGYELRNQYSKLSSAPKDIKTFDLGAKEGIAFEGFFDFLSFISIQKNFAPIKANYVVLNSLSLFEKGRAFMEKHEHIKLYLDHDKTGQKFTRYALSLSKKYKDESGLYKNYKDLNDWIMNIGKDQKKRLKL
ncbi:toprim domain-containing protein [Segetibacter koreensis]|uniref:toprim domain-containing protein n=1 Tax=Segetibacter koreensis TaxID=398037 RepID=UPI00037E5CA7|nr:toprim domain-containing protein [Segetibacter koreensis]